MAKDRISLEEFNSKIADIKGFFGKEEAWALKEFVATMPDLYLPIVEIGSYMGRSTYCLARGIQENQYELAKNSYVVAIDHFKGSFEHQVGHSHASEEIAKFGTTFLSFKNNIEKNELNDVVLPIATDSINASRFWNKQIQMVFIDAEHTYESVKSDFENWSPFVIYGGYIAIHDIEYINTKGELVDKFPGVTRFYKEIDKTKYVEYFSMGSSMRILKKVVS